MSNAPAASRGCPYIPKDPSFHSPRPPGESRNVRRAPSAPLSPMRRTRGIIETPAQIAKRSAARQASRDNGALNPSSALHNLSRMLPTPPPPPTNGRSRIRRSSIPNAPRHAAAVIFEMGQAGRSWSEIAATLHAWNFRTARNRHWTVLNARQFWHTIATERMKLDRSRALEQDRGIETSLVRSCSRPEKALNLI